MRWRPDHPYLLLSATTLFWAGNWIVGRAFRDDVPPIALSFWRWIVALACVLPLAWREISRHRALIVRHWRVLTLLGALGTALYNALTYIGLQYTTATNGVLLNSFIPIVIVAIGWAVLGRRPGWPAAIGIAVSFAGVLTIVARGSPATLADLSLNVGDLWIIASVFGWAAYTLCLRLRPAELPPLATLACIAAAGLVLMVPALLVEWLVFGRSVNPTPAALAGIVYTGVFPAFLGYVFWNRAVAEIGGEQAGLFIHLMPVFGVLLSSLFLGEHPQAFHFAGITLILAGIALTGRRPPAVAR
jgi:drug/metabolite transporter (DMT)-like permease